MAAPSLRRAFAGACFAGHDDGGCSHGALGVLIVERILSASIDGDDIHCRHPRESGDPASVLAFAGMTARIAVRKSDGSIILSRIISGFRFCPHNHG